MYHQFADDTQLLGAMNANDAALAQLSGRGSRETMCSSTPACQEAIILSTAS